MPRPVKPLINLSLEAWKWTLSIIFLIVLVSMISEVTSAWYAFSSGKHGSLGVTLKDQAALYRDGQNTNQLIIDELPELIVDGLREPSPLAAAGAEVNDILTFANPIDRWRKFKDETIKVTLKRGDTVREVSVEAIQVPITEPERVDYISRMLLAFLALASALFVGLMGAKDSADRRLAITFVALSLNAYYNFNYSSGTWIFAFSKLAHLATNGLIWFGAASFCLTYRNQSIAAADPAFQPTFRNDFLTFLFRGYAVLAGVVFLYSIRFGLGYETPKLWELSVASILVGFVTIVGSLYHGWSRSKGETRDRFLWIVGSVSIFAIPSIFSWFPQFEGAVLISYMGQFVMYVGMIYSVMKYRILNFGFAMSRTLILSVITLVLLCTLEIIRYLLEHYVNASPGTSRIRELGVVVVLFLIFHHLHNRMKGFLERLLLRRWYIREQRLRKFAKDAANFTSIEALLNALVSALDKFTDGDKSAVYLRESDGTYKLYAGSSEFGPDIVPADDGMLVALQSDTPALEMSELLESSLQSVLQYDLALPMIHRGLLSGFVVLDANKHGSSYRPDQVAALRVVIQQISLALFALKATILENELLRLQKKLEKDDIALQIMSGRRKALRDDNKLTLVMDAPHLAVGDSIIDADRLSSKF